ncbi:DUF1960-domain-containing protein [Pseudohyphozyma bogoriensis]|nr:DUF1960-domain-containing protein [Pseudohyphozyma bogoriensis]
MPQSGSMKGYHKVRTPPHIPVVYKPDSMSTDETVPLAEIVDAFDIFHTGQGAQGLLERPSNQQLSAVFDTHNVPAIIETMLEKGKLQQSTAPLKYGSKNDSMGGQYQSSRGSVGGGR